VWRLATVLTQVIFFRNTAAAFVTLFEKVSLDSIHVFFKLGFVDDFLWALQKNHKHYNKQEERRSAKHNKWKVTLYKFNYLVHNRVL